MGISFSVILLRPMARRGDGVQAAFAVAGEIGDGGIDLG